MSLKVYEIMHWHVTVNVWVSYMYVIPHPFWPGYKAIFPPESLYTICPMIHECWYGFQNLAAPSIRDVVCKCYFCPSGTFACAPAEWYKQHFYNLLPATVWSLGLLLYSMLEGDLPFKTQEEIVQGNFTFQTYPSPGELTVTGTMITLTNACMCASGISDTCISDTCSWTELVYKRQHQDP